LRPTSFSELAKWCSGRLTGSADLLINRISTDSRRLERGEAFIALRGPRFDGHKFIPQALEAGASALVVEESFLMSNPGIPIPAVAVENTMDSLVEIARGYRDTLEVMVFGITGSNGKTTTKDMLGTLMSGVMDTAVAPASFNNRIGVSLSILAIEDSHQAAVLELGMNRAGEIRELAGMSRPEIGIVTNIGSAHLGFLGSISATAKAKGELLEGLTGKRLAILNRDNFLTWQLRTGFEGQVVSYGNSPGSDFRLLSACMDGKGQRLVLELEGEKLEVFLPLAGKHNAMNFLGALAAAISSGNPAEKVLAGVKNLSLPGMRFERIEFNGAVIINDAFNANPASMRAALEAWLELPASGRRIMVSGDMLELGEYSPAEHYSWGQAASDSVCDLFIFVGSASRQSFIGASRGGFSSENLKHFDTAEQAGKYLSSIIEPGDSVLLKGSRLMALEKILEELVLSDTSAGGGE